MVTIQEALKIWCVHLAELNDVRFLEAVPFTDLPYPFCTKLLDAPTLSPFIGPRIVAVRSKGVVAVGIHFVTLVTYFRTFHRCWSHLRIRCSYKVPLAIQIMMDIYPTMIVACFEKWKSSFKLSCRIKEIVERILAALIHVSWITAL